MSIFEVGRLCVKIAGRDAGNRCVIIEKMDDHFVVVDGATRRRKVNINHLEPLQDLITIKANASHEEVGKQFEKLGLAVWNTKPKPAVTRPTRHKVIKNATPEPKPTKKAVKNVVSTEAPLTT